LGSVSLKTEVKISYVSIRTTENYQFDKFRTAGVTGNAIINSQGQGNNPVCSTRDEISKPYRPFSPRAATVDDDDHGCMLCCKSFFVVRWDGKVWV